jgi:hypothetical protein
MGIDTDVAHVPTIPLGRRHFIYGMGGLRRIVSNLRRR